MGLAHGEKMEGHSVKFDNNEVRVKDRR